MPDQKPKSKRTPARIRADRKHAEKRKGQPRLGGAYLNEEEFELLMRVKKHFKTKKEIILEGLRVLDKKLNK